MEISIFSVYPLNLYEQGFFGSVDAAFSSIKETGINKAEVFTFELENKTLSDYASALKRNGLDFETLIITSPFAVCDEKNYIAEIDKIKKYAEDAEKEGAKFIMLVPDAESETKSKEAVCETMITGLNEITSYIKNSSLKATIENFSLHSHPYCTIEELKYVFDNVNDLKFTYDPANFYCVKVDPIKAYDALKEHIIHAHAKDWVEDEAGSIVRPSLPVLDGCVIGDGILPFEEIVNRFKNDGYDGRFVIEINSNTVTFDMLKKSTDFLRRTFNA